MQGARVQKDCLHIFLFITKESKAINHIFYMNFIHNELIKIQTKPVVCIFNRGRITVQIVQSFIIKQYSNIIVIIQIGQISQSQFYYKYQMTTCKTRLPNQNLNCCICLSTSCFQAVDHTYFSFQNLKALIENSKRNNDIVDRVKQLAAETYVKIKQQLIKKIERDQMDLQIWLNQFYFNHISEKTNKKLLCEITEQDYSQLPTKSLAKVIKSLKNKVDSQQVHCEWQEKINEGIKFLQKIDIPSICDRTLRLLAVERVVRESNRSLLSLSSKRSISQIHNPEQYLPFPQNYSYKRMQLTKTTKTAQLSNINMKDSDVIREIPRISAFKNLKGIQIRNNLLTSLSCRIIANNLSFLLQLDIRGNKIGDEGIEFLINGIPKIKNFLISETGATDKSGRLIAEKMDYLEMFWSEQTKLSGEVAYLIGSKPKLKVMSIAGNPIDKHHASLLQGLFIRKGYIVI